MWRPPLWQASSMPPPRQPCLPYDNPPPGFPAPGFQDAQDPGLAPAPPLPQPPILQHAQDRGLAPAPPLPQPPILQHYQYAALVPPLPQPPIVQHYQYAPPPQIRYHPHAQPHRPPNYPLLSTNFLQHLHHDHGYTGQPWQPQHHGQTAPAPLHGHHEPRYGMPSPSAYSMPLHNPNHPAPLPCALGPPPPVQPPPPPPVELEPPPPPLVQPPPPPPVEPPPPPPVQPPPPPPVEPPPPPPGQLQPPPPASTSPLLAGAGQARALGLPLTPRLAPIPSLNRAGTSLAVGATPQVPHGSAVPTVSAPPPLLSGAYLGFASPLLKDLSQKKTFIEFASGTKMGNVGEGSTNKEVVEAQAWNELIDIARQSMEILEALNPLPFPDYVETIRPLQIPCDFVGAIPADIPPGTQSTKMTETFRALLDSLVFKMITSLEEGKSWGGKLSFHDILVLEGRCVIKMSANLQGIRKNAQEDLRLLHSLITQCINAPYPPHLERLLKLLLYVPLDFDTNNMAKKEYLTSIKEHASLASMARIVTLLLNFGQSKNCFPKNVSKDFRQILRQVAHWGMSKKRKRGEEEEVRKDWRKTVARYTLLQKVRKPPPKKKDRKKKKKRARGKNQDKDDLYDLAYFMRNFAVHAPDHMLDRNDEVQLEDYSELYHIMVYHFGDAVADLVDGVFKAAEQQLHPLLESTWRTYTTQ